MEKITHCLLYHPEIDVKRLHPEMNVNQLLESVNTHHLPTITASPTPIQRNIIAKLVRLNWLIQDLKTNNLMKPFVVRKTNEHFQVINGDTRMQALEFNPHITHVNCVLTTSVEYQDNYEASGWITVNSRDHLANLLQMRVKDLIYDTDWRFELVKWMEFAIPEAANHMHDEKIRYFAFYDWYVNQIISSGGKPPIIDRDWLETPRTWNC